MRPDFTHEASFWQKGASFVLGLDEAGRGCLAGPVAAAVAVWPQNHSLSNIPDALRDSKQMTEKNREAIFSTLTSQLEFFGIGMASALEVDRYNILRATHLAFARAFMQFLERLGGEQVWQKLSPTAFAYIADGNRPLLGPAASFFQQPELMQELQPLRKFFSLFPPKELAVVKGDGKVATIAAASVLAKVSRDRYMQNLAEKFPEYAFSAHKGYGTAAHVELLRKHGPCSEHRKTFAPVREIENPSFSL